MLYSAQGKSEVEHNFWRSRVEHKNFAFALLCVSGITQTIFFGAIVHDKSRERSFLFGSLCVTKTTESLFFCAVVRDKNNWELFTVTV